MRHIKQDDLLGLIGDDWLLRAEAALEALKQLPPEGRSKFIKDHSELWSELKEHLSKLSHEKCWYSEARVPLSELEIDHFRPKNRVTACLNQHSGYWWLAFEWKNFRLACSLANKRRHDIRGDAVFGKGCHFPLLDENARVPDANPADVTPEKPKLIDPCVMADVRLLDYAVEFGKVVERYDRVSDAVRHDRAKISIELYHLNEGTLIRDRKDLQVAVTFISRQIESLCRQREAGGLSAEQESEYDRLINQVSGYINATSRYSAFARACLLQQADLGCNKVLLVAS
jgi:uncharacterized protein (TIGR02646 family)